MCITYCLHPHSGWFFVSRLSGAQQAKAHNKTRREGTGPKEAARTLPVAMEAITAAGAAAFEGGGTPSLKNAGASGRVA